MKSDAGAPHGESLPLSLKPVLLVPTGEWHVVLPDVLEWDLESARVSIGADFNAQMGLSIEPAPYGDDYISGLGAETPFFLFDLWTWVGRVADTAALAVLGGQLIRYLAATAARLRESKLDEVDAGKMRPVMGAPLTRLVAAKYAVDDNPGSASQLKEWQVEPLFSLLVGDAGFFHAQQSFLVTGRGDWVAFIGIFDAYGSPQMMAWSNTDGVTPLGS